MVVVGGRRWYVVVAVAWDLRSMSAIVPNPFSQADNVFDGSVCIEQLPERDVNQSLPSPKADAVI